MSLFLLALPLLLGAPQADAPGASRDVERPAVYDRTPDELPRVTPGRWNGLFDAGGQVAPERLEALDVEVVAAQQAADTIHSTYPRDRLEALVAAGGLEPDGGPDQ